MPTRNRKRFVGRDVCTRCGQEWFNDELPENSRGQKICKNCWDDNENEEAE